jgi:hypothetical protein
MGMWLQRWWGRSTKTHKTTRDVAAAWRSLGTCAPQRQSRQGRERAFRALRARPFPHPRSQFSLSFRDVTSKLGFGSPVHFYFWNAPLKKKRLTGLPCYYLGSFDTNSIIFRNVKIFKIFSVQITKICVKENVESSQEYFICLKEDFKKLINNLTYMWR